MAEVLFSMIVGSLVTSAENYLLEADNKGGWIYGAIEDHSGPVRTTVGYVWVQCSVRTTVGYV